MFLLKTALLNINRRRRKSMLVLLICLLNVIFINLYMQNIDTNKSKLISISQSLPVSARVVNHNGSKMTGLDIDESTISYLEGSSLVKNLCYSAQLSGKIPGLQDETAGQMGISMLCVNDIQALPNLQNTKIELTGGVSADFLHGSEALCIADEAFLQANHLAVGDTVSLDLSAMQYEPSGYIFSYKPLANGSLRIAGSMAQKGKTQMTTSILCPASWAKGMYENAGLRFCPDSASFTVADPLDMDAFKSDMKMHFWPVSSTAKESTKGDSLMVDDEIFIKTASRVKNTLAMQQAFAPVIFLMVALLGYAMAYLLMQDRRIDIAIMRSLGTGRGACVLTMFLEYTVLSLASCLLGTLCAFVLLKPGLGTLAVATLFLASLLLGVLAAAFQLGRGNTMTGLTKAET